MINESKKDRLELYFTQVRVERYSYDGLKFIRHSRQTTISFDEIINKEREGRPRR